MLKKFTWVLLMFGTLVVPAQEKKFDTQSISIDELIGFVAENYKSKFNSDGTHQNIIWLIQYNNNLSEEKQVILKQSIKLLSSRLSEEDRISILTYSGVNGVVLKQTKGNDAKKILSATNDFNKSIKKVYEGIDFAYEYADENFDGEAINSILMIRNQDASVAKVQKSGKKKNSQVLLLTAISILPEVLSVIKN